MPSCPAVAELSFSRAFLDLTGHRPYPWQSALFADMLDGNIPEQISLPTGAGKTSIMAVWLLALAEQQTRRGKITLPRRMMWVVNHALWKGAPLE